MYKCIYVIMLSEKVEYKIMIIILYNFENFIKVFIFNI